MKTKKYIKRIFSFVLATILLFSTIPVSLAVQDMLVEEADAKIVREVTELREESVKHFLCEDGSYIAATYSAPVHYKENGEWKEIDNSLSLDRTSLSESGKPTYTTKAGGLDVSIPQDFSDEQKITAKNKGYEISFGLNANQDNVSLKKSASVVDVESLSSNTEVKNIAIEQSTKTLTSKKMSAADVAEKHNEEMMAADNQSSAVTFNNVFPNTDLEYIVSSSSIKENIVVYEPQTEYTYSFDMDFEGLLPVTHTDGSISLVEPSDPENFVFWIEAPYMYDANNEESIDIEMTLEENGDEYLLTLVASEEWINNENRTFPVVIDPTVHYLSDSEINDVFVIDGLYADSPRVKNELRVGRNLTNVTRTYIKPTMPTNIPNGSEISSAYLKLYQKSYYQAPFADDISIRVYDCYNVATWKSHEVSWNNQPFNNSDNGYKSTTGAVWLASKTASDSASYYTFTITEAVQRWVDGGVNNGFMLASSDESTKTQVDLYSSRVSDSANHPDIWLTYSTPGVSYTSWYTDSQASTSSAVEVTASKSWTVSSNQSWLTITNKTSSGFKMKTSENPDTSERTGTVTVTMGNTIIGTINVTQSGSAPNLLVDTTCLNFESKGGTKTISVNSNTSWTITTPSWITAEPSSGSGNQSVNITVGKNEGNFTNEDNITICAGSINEPVTVKQLDKISNYFSKVNDLGEFVQKDSSEYNHALATWSMELSNYAYNPIVDGVAQVIPGAVMNTDKTAQEELEQYGFYTYAYNYGNSDKAAHIIAQRTITSEDGTERPLIVIVARGSETAQDWIMNFATQIGFDYEKFTDGCNMVLDSLHNGTENTSDCDGCLGEGCLGCTGYNVDNAVFLVTGHSLGAAIANLTAAHLNSCDGANCEYCSYNENEAPQINDVYSYTFGTPNVLNGAIEGNEKIEYENIFNILNNNDTVTFVPHSFNINKWNTNEWFRYGQDFYFTMPFIRDFLPLFETEWIGLGGHIMSVYLSWMTNLSTKIGVPVEEISESDLDDISTQNIARGLLPKLLKIKCPVSVTLYDGSGNIVAFESQDETLIQTMSTENEITYSDGIVSWITEEGEKVFLIPYGYEPIDAHIEAYDYGTMSFTIETVGVIEPLESKTFNDVVLHPSKTFVSEISSTTNIEDTSLSIMEDGEIVGEITELNPPFKGITAEQTDVIYGDPIRFTIITDNTVSEINLQNISIDRTMNLVPNGIYVNGFVEDGNNIIWNIGFYPLPSYIGENIYNISVKSGEEWYDYENVISIYVSESSS